MDSHFEIPRLTSLIRHALPRLIEGTLAPVAVFYLGLYLLGMYGGVAAAVAWVYGGIALRLARRKTVPGTLMLAGLAVTTRAGMAAMTGSAIVYFLQPALGTVLVALAFLASIPLGRPLAQKIALDLIPLPEAFLRHSRVRQFFLRMSLLWAMTFLINAALSLWLLFSQSISTYLLVRTSAVALLGAAAAAITVIGFRRCVRRVAAEPLLAR